MTGACLLIGTLALPLSTPTFTLAWTHSVERTLWREEWEVAADGLLLIRAAVKGSGAGMEPGVDAVLQNGWWVWHPTLPPQRAVTLASSGATSGGWRLCDGDQCRDIGAAPGAPVSLQPCPPPAEIRR